MRRTKEWWARLTEAERSEIYWFEHPSGNGHSSMIPDDCRECYICSTPFAGIGGLCPRCDREYDRILKKADG